MVRSSSAMSCSVASVRSGSEDRRLLPSMARKSDVKLLRAPSARVVGSQIWATSADSRLKLLRRQMLNIPSTATSEKNSRNTAARWERIDCGCRIKGTIRCQKYSVAAASVTCTYTGGPRPVELARKVLPENVFFG